MYEKPIKCCPYIVTECKSQGRGVDKKCPWNISLVYRTYRSQNSTKQIILCGLHWHGAYMRPLGTKLHYITTKRVSTLQMNACSYIWVTHLVGCGIFHGPSVANLVTLASWLLKFYAKRPHVYTVSHCSPHICIFP